MDGIILKSIWWRIKMISQRISALGSNERTNKQWEGDELVVESLSTLLLIRVKSISLIYNKSNNGERKKRSFVLDSRISRVCLKLTTTMSTKEKRTTDDQSCLGSFTIEKILTLTNWIHCHEYDDGGGCDVRSRRTKNRLENGEKMWFNENGRKLGCCSCWEGGIVGGCSKHL